MLSLGHDSDDVINRFAGGGNVTGGHVVRGESSPGARDMATARLTSNAFEQVDDYCDDDAAWDYVDAAHYRVVQKVTPLWY